MNKFIQKNKFILILLTIVICLSCAYGLTAKLDPTVNAVATAKRSATDYSWATMSSAAAQYFGWTTSPDGDHGTGVHVPDSKTGFAGAFLGYLSGGEKESHYVIAAIESDTVKYSYSTLNSLDQYMSDSENSLAWRDSAKIYAGFGYALTSCGIDEPVIVGQATDNKRNIIGPVVLIVFLLCMALPEFFKMVLTFLSVANPFKLFIGSGSVLKSIVPTIAAGDGFDARDTAMQTAMSNALNTLSDAVTGLYNQLYSLSFFAVIPIMIALALFSWLVLRKQFGSVFKNLAIRVVFIGLGVPLLLACYTAAIDSVKDFMIDTSLGTPISVVTSTFCDYGNWALGASNDVQSYLRLPQGVKLTVNQNSQTYTYDASRSTSDRRIVQLINGVADYNLRSSALLSSSPGLDAKDIANDDKALVRSTRGSSSSTRVTAVINMLQRYTKGEYITAANFASKMNKSFSANYEYYSKLFNQSNSWDDFVPNHAPDNKFSIADGERDVNISADDAKSFAENRLTTGDPFGNATLDVFRCGTPYSDFSVNTGDGVYIGSTMADTGGGSRNWGNFTLSKMAAYNLLSSTFSDTVITVYSPADASTNQVQLAHYAVSVAGQGYMELAYVFDACAIMCCLMVLGYGYGFALLFACFKGLIQIFPKVLTGMIGSIRGIAGTVALVAALIIEILGTCIMYSLGSMFIGGVYDLIEIPLATLLSSIADLPPQASALVTVVASAVIIIYLTKMLLKYRTAVVKSVSETATGFINKFMETNVVAPNLESNMSAGSLASIGLGMAMVGASTPAGSKLADRASDLTDKVANADADKVASAAMSGTSLTGVHGEKYASAADAEKAKNEADMHESSSSLSASDTGGHYSNGNPSGSGTLADESESAVKTTDDVAADYVNDNGADFEKEIGYSSDSEGASSNSKLADKNKAGDNANSDSDAEDEFQGYTGKTQSNGSVEEWENGRLVAKWDPDGNKIVDNSTQEITGTQTTDITSEKQGEADNASSKNIADNSSGSQTGSKFVITDSDGHQQEVSIVNAKTGAAYTQADKDAGANYDVVDSSGKSIYGNLEGGMSANTIGMSNGQPTVMVAPGSGGTNAYGGGGMYTVSQAPVPTVEAPAASGSAGSQNVTQNVNQTNVTNTTANTSNMTTENTTQNMNTQQFANVSGGNAGSVQSAPSQGQTTIVHDNAGSSPVNVNVAGAGVSGPAQVHVDFPGSGGSNAGGSAPVSSTVTEHVTNTVTNQTTESVIYSQGGSQGFSSGNQQNNTYVTSNTTVNQDVSNNVQNNVNNQSNTTVNSSDNSSGVSLGFGSLGSGSHGGNGHRK